MNSCNRARGSASKRRMGRAVAVALVVAGCARAAPRAPAQDETKLPRAVVALVDFAEAADMKHQGSDEFRLAVPRPTLSSTYDPELRDAWDSLVMAVHRWGTPAQAPPAIRLVRLAGTLNQELERSRLDYYVEVNTVRFGEGMALELRGYRIEQRIALAAGPRRARVLAMRALAHDYRDELGIHDRQAVGRPALIFMDRIEPHVLDHLLPICADGAEFPVAGDAWADKALPRLLAVTAGAAMREELRAVVGGDAAVVARVGSLAARRVKVMFDDPDRDRVLDRIDAELARPEHRRVVRAIIRAFSVEIAVHEGEHALDDDRPTPLPHPELERGLTDAQAEELSAMLAELAADAPMPRVALWIIARRAFMKPIDPDYGDAPAMVIVALARQLGATAPVLHDGEIDRDRLVELAVIVSRHSAPELRRAAAAAWTALFGEPYTRIEIERE